MSELARVQQRFNHAAHHYAHHAVVQKKMVDSLLTHSLPYLNTQALFALDLGSGTGNVSQALLAKMPASTMIGLDLAVQMLQADLHSTIRIHGDFHHLPFQDESFDQIFSTNALHWATDFKQVLAEGYRVLKPQGTLHLGLFIEGTLREIQSSWCKTRVGPRILNFLPATHYDTLLHTLGFNRLELHTLKISYDFSTPKVALESLKKIGSHYPHTAHTSMISPAQLKRFEQYYWTDYHTDQGTVPVSYVLGFFIFKKGKF